VLNAAKSLNVTRVGSDLIYVVVVGADRRRAKITKIVRENRKGRLGQRGKGGLW